MFHEVERTFSVECEIKCTFMALIIAKKSRKVISKCELGNYFA